MATMTSSTINTNHYKTQRHTLHTLVNIFLNLSKLYVAYLARKMVDKKTTKCKLF